MPFFFFFFFFVYSKRKIVTSKKKTIKILIYLHLIPIFCVKKKYHLSTKMSVKFNKRKNRSLFGIGLEELNELYQQDPSEVPYIAQEIINFIKRHGKSNNNFLY